MSDLWATGSDTDVSSDSSWTLLDEGGSGAGADERQQEVEIEEVSAPDHEDDGNVCVNEYISVKETDVIEDINTTGSEISVNEENAPVQGCASFDEFLQERQIVHDYGFDEQVAKYDRRIKRKYKRRSQDYVSTLKMLATFLSIAGLTFAGVLLPRSFPFNNELRRGYKNKMDAAPVIPEATLEDLNAEFQLPKITERVKEAELNLNAAMRQFHLKNMESNAPNEKCPLGPKPMNYQDFMKHKHCSRVKLLDHVPSKNEEKAVPSPIASASKRVVRTLVEEIKDLGSKIGRKLFPAQKKDKLPSQGNNRTSRYFLNLHLYIALHILNDLVLLSATTRLQRDLLNKAQLLRKKVQLKRCRKLRLRKLSAFTKSPDHVKASNQILQLESNDTNLLGEAQCPTRRIPKSKSEKFKCDSSFEANDSIFEFLQELQNIKAKKIDLLKSFNLKSRKDYLKEEKESRNLDKFYLSNTYENTISNNKMKEKMLCCLSYLHARKRDFSTLIAKMDVNEFVTDSPKYNQFLEKLFQLEYCIVEFFQHKCKELGKNQSVKDIKREKPYCEMAAVVELLVAREKSSVKPKVVALKDASTERYVVPIKSNVDLTSEIQPEITAIAPPLEPKASKKALMERKMSLLCVQSFSTNEFPVEDERKISQEKLEVLKTWKEKYEQLKMFWKSRQEYYDKRVQICDMIKEIIPPVRNNSSDVKEQGIEILDSLIKEVTSRRSVCHRNVNENELNHTADIIDNVFKDIKLVFTEDDKQNVMQKRDLYSKLFERKGQHIQKAEDNIFSAPKYPRVHLRATPSKYDQKKTYRERIAKNSL